MSAVFRAASTPSKETGAIHKLIREELESVLHLEASTDLANYCSWPQNTIY